MLERRNVWGGRNNVVDKIFAWWGMEMQVRVYEGCEGLRLRGCSSATTLTDDESACHPNVRFLNGMWCLARADIESLALDEGTYGIVYSIRKKRDATFASK